MAGEEIWKFAYGPPVTQIIFVLIVVPFPFWFQTPRRFILPCIAASLNLIFDYRSQFFITGAAWLFSIASVIVSGRRRPLVTLLLLCISFVLVARLGLFTYGYFASSGSLGEVTREKYEFQTSGSLSLLQAGRTESLASIQAILDSPLLGHGSWARDSHYVDILNERLLEAGYSIGAHNESDLIPTHSHVLGAWVESGVVGAVFWSYIMYLLAVALYNNFQNRTRYSSLFFYILLGLGWEVVFSPFGLNSRFIDPIGIIAALILLRPRSIEISRRPVQ